jgi:hypothetical protein
MQLLANHRERTRRLPDMSTESDRSLKVCWNQMVLRSGDQVPISSDRSDTLETNLAPKAKVGSGNTSNKYQTDGFVRMCWNEIGKSARRAAGPVSIMDSNRASESLLTLATIAWDLVQDRVKDIVEEVRLLHRAGLAQGLHVQRSYDGTPTLIRFGKLQALLEPYARYLIMLPDIHGVQRWTTVPYDKYLELRPSMPTYSGVVEVLAQRLRANYV